MLYTESQKHGNTEHSLCIWDSKKNLFSVFQCFCVSVDEFLTGTQ